VEGCDLLVFRQEAIGSFIVRKRVVMLSLVDVAGLEPAAPLLAKQWNKIYVVGPSSFVLRLVPRFSLVFGGFWTQIGPKFWDEPL
jgi:hypothetical protein